MANFIFTDLGDENCDYRYSVDTLVRSPKLSLQNRDVFVSF